MRSILRREYATERRGSRSADPATFQLAEAFRAAADLPRAWYRTRHCRRLRPHGI